jgi:hypothetical protein
MSPVQDAAVSARLDTIPAEVFEALLILRRAREIARELQTDPWEFAVGIAELLAVGLSGTVVRWLVARGLIEHALERLAPGRASRTFRRMRNLALSPRTCLVLTAEGQRLLESWEARQREMAARADPNGAVASALRAAVPHWDSEQRQLWYRDRLVKLYRTPAASQETILAAFEEEGWPPRIDDPLGQEYGQDPQERLHEAVKGLNRGQVQRLLEFHRDGSGEGVTWRAREGQ